MNAPSSRAARAAHAPLALWADRSGAQAIEFALTAPALLLMILGAMEFSRLIWTLSALHLSCEEAARCGAVGICTSTSAPTYAATVTPQLGFASSVFTVPGSPSCGGFQVSASYSFTFIASRLFPYTPTLTATACVP